MVTFVKGTKEAPNKMNCRACYCWLSSPFVQMARITTPKVVYIHNLRSPGKKGFRGIKDLERGSSLDYLGGPSLVTWLLSRSSSCRGDSRGMCGCGWHQDATWLASTRRKGHGPRTVGGPRKLERQEHKWPAPASRKERNPNSFLILAEWGLKVQDSKFILFVCAGLLQWQWETNHTKTKNETVLPGYPIVGKRIFYKYFKDKLQLLCLKLGKYKNVMSNKTNISIGYTWYQLQKYLLLVSHCKSSKINMQR